MLVQNGSEWFREIASCPVSFCLQACVAQNLGFSPPGTSLCLLEEQATPVFHGNLKTLLHPIQAPVTLKMLGHTWVVKRREWWLSSKHMAIYIYIYIYIWEIIIRYICYYCILLSFICLLFVFIYQMSPSLARVALEVLPQKHDHPCDAAPQSGAEMFRGEF